MDYEEIKKRISTHVKFTEHARAAMNSYRVTTDTVLSALDNGEIIEEYENDRPFPSCLVFGKTADSRPLHIVCALPPHVNILIVDTTYIPSEDRWIDFRRRKRD